MDMSRTIAQGSTSHVCLPASWKANCFGIFPWIPIFPHHAQNQKKSGMPISCSPSFDKGYGIKKLINQDKTLKSNNSSTYYVAILAWFWSLCCCVPSLQIWNWGWIECTMECMSEGYGLPWRDTWAITYLISNPFSEKMIRYTIYA